MIPGNTLSDPTEYSAFLYGDSLTTTFTTDYEMGGLAIQDASLGSQYQLWRADLVANTNPSLSDVILTPQTTGSPVLIYTGGVITEISFTFDQNMTPFLAFVEGGLSKYYWYDHIVNEYVTVSLPSNITHPRVSLDDKRDIQSALGHTDIILAYVDNTANTLCFRMQRERFANEHILKTGIDSNAILVKLGMNIKNRLQFELRTL